MQRAHAYCGTRGGRGGESPNPALFRRTVAWQFNLAWLWCATLTVAPQRADKDLVDAKVTVVDVDGGINTVRRKAKAAPIVEWNGAPGCAGVESRHGHHVRIPGCLLTARCPIPRSPFADLFGDVH